MLATKLNATPGPNLPAFEKFGRMINPSEDPTKSKGIRARWVAQVCKRHNEVMRWVRQSVAVDDRFNLAPGDFIPMPEAPVQQIEAFMNDLRRVQRDTVLERPAGLPWITPFVREAFGKGMLRGNKDLLALARGQRRERAKSIKSSPLGETPLSDAAEAEVQRARNSATVYIINQEGLFEAPTLRPDNIQDAIQAGERARLFELEVFRTWEGLTNVTTQVNSQVAAIIAQGLESRVTPTQMAKDINDRVDKIGKTRSEMIARTETVAANNRGAVAEFAQAEAVTGFDVLVQWETALDSRVRDTHIVRHGDVYTREVGLSLIGEPNCLLPDAMVFSPSRLERVFKRRYDGAIVTIKTASGNELTCTANHPILTRDGAVAAQCLKVGNNILCSAVADSPGAVSENEDHVKARIEDIVSAFALKADRSTTPCRALNFHGDGTDGDVAVVWTDRELMCDVKAVGLKHGGEFFLKRVDFRFGLTSGGAIDSVLKGALHAADRIVRRCYLSAARFLGHSGPFDPLGVALASRGNPSLCQDGIDGAASNPDLFTNGVGAESLVEEVHDSPLVDPVDGSGDRSESSKSDSALDNLDGDSMLLSEALQSAPFGEVFADEIISVDMGVYDGHVYNLQTRVGIYIAQNVLQNNCRCALLPYIPAIEGEVDLSSGKAALALTPEGAKGPAKREREKLDVVEPEE